MVTGELLIFIYLFERAAQLVGGVTVPHEGSNRYLCHGGAKS